MKKRISTMLLSALLVINISACDLVQKKEVNEKAESASHNTETIESNTNNLKDINQSIPKAYTPILKLYKELLTNSYIIVDNRNQETEIPFFHDLYSISVDVSNCSNAESAGFALKDLNNDKTDELILLDDRGVLLAIFTLKDGEPILIDSFSFNNHRGGIDASGVVYKDSYSKGETWEFKVLKLLENGEVDCLEFGIYNSDSGSVPAQPTIYRNGHKETADEKAVEALYTQYSNNVSYSTPTGIISNLNLNFIYAQFFTPQENK